MPFLGLLFVSPPVFIAVSYANANDLAAAITAIWLETNAGSNYRYVVFTGGEPALQLDSALLDALHKHHFEIAIETNGTLPLPAGIDWVCVSPKIGADLVIKQADEIKLAIPQIGHTQLELILKRFEGMDYRHRFLQPIDGLERDANTALAVKLCQKRPLWRLSLQTHKYIGMP